MADRLLALLCDAPQQFGKKLGVEERTFFLGMELGVGARGGEVKDKHVLFPQF